MSVAVGAIVNRNYWKDLDENFDLIRSNEIVNSTDK